MPLSDYLSQETITRLLGVKINVKKKSNEASQGDLKSVKSGEGVEFFEHQNYAEGMNIKHIDWKLYAKTEKLYVKKYEQESNMHAVIYFDVSASQKGLKEEKAKFLYAAKTAMAIAYLYVKQGIHVSFVSFDEKEKENVLGQANVHILNEIASVLDRENLLGKSDFETSIKNFRKYIKANADVYIISDFFFENTESIRKAAKLLKGLKAKFRFIQVLSQEEAEFNFTKDSIFIDSETNERFRLNPMLIRKEYLKTLSDYKNAIKKTAHENNGAYYSFTTNEDLVKNLIKAV